MLFFLGTIVAVAGWLGGFATLRFTASLSRNIAIVGHIVQIVSVIGAMLVPEEGHRDNEHDGSDDQEFMHDDRM